MPAVEHWADLDRWAAAGNSLCGRSPRVIEPTAAPGRSCFGWSNRPQERAVHLAWPAAVHGAPSSSPPGTNLASRFPWLRWWSYAVGSSLCVSQCTRRLLWCLERPGGKASEAPTKPLKLTAAASEFAMHLSTSASAAGSRDGKPPSLTGLWRCRWLRSRWCSSTAGLLLFPGAQPIGHHLPGEVAAAFHALGIQPALWATLANARNPEQVHPIVRLLCIPDPVCSLSTAGLPNRLWWAKRPHCW